MAAAGEMTLELEAVHALHPQVEDETSHVPQVALLEEGLRRRKHADSESHRAEQARQRFQDGPVVVDHGNDRCLVHTEAT